MSTRFARFALVTIGLALAGAIATPVSASDGSFWFRVDRKARLSDANHTLTVTGIYSCREPSSGGDYSDGVSGFGGVVTQVVSGKKVVSGGGGISPAALECDGALHPFTFQMAATYSGIPDWTWRKGNAVGNFEGQICNTGMDECGSYRVDTTLAVG